MRVALDWFVIVTSPLLLYGLWETSDTVVLRWLAFMWAVGVIIGCIKDRAASRPALDGDGRG